MFYSCRLLYSQCLWWCRPSRYSEVNLSSICIHPILIHSYFLAGNEPCPQPQTSEHLAAIEIMKLKHIIILQNKIDLVTQPQAKEQHLQIIKFVQG